MKKFLNYLCAVLLTVSAAVWADAPMKRLGHVDERTVSFGYSPNQVYTITVHVGYLIQIQLSDKETIVDMVTGFDDKMWVTAQSSPYILNVKPILLTGDTNMSLTTQIGNTFRTYMFHLKVREYDPDDIEAEPMIWKVKFWYPKSKARKRVKKQIPPNRPEILNTPESERNYEYYYSGNKRLAPGVAFDNGTFTFFRFSPDHDWPLIYAVDMNTGNERLVNTRREGPDVIVEGVYDILVLRYGQEHACVFNATRVTPKQSRQVKSIMVRKAPQKDEKVTKPKGGVGDEVTGQ